jgi:hypothetical protein
LNTPRKKRRYERQSKKKAALSRLKKESGAA